MDTLDALGFARRLWPRLVAFVVAAAFYFFPQLSSDLIMQAAQQRAQRMVAALEDSLELHSAPPQHRSRH